MLKSIARVVAALLLIAGPVQAAFDEVHLKNRGIVSGEILTEKKEQVVVDIGYTVVVVPREAISKIVRSGEKPDAPEAGSPAQALETELHLFASATERPDRRTVKELVRELGESVVQVRTPGGLGSGFFIHTDGYLITNFHVIEGETQIAIEVYHQNQGQLERRSYKNVRIVAMNKFMDLALLKINDEGAPKFKRVLLGEADLLAVGDDVFAIGSPLGLERTVTEGILSTKARQMQGSLYLQTNAQINPGNSGGPLFNLRGEVVGVTNMKMTFGEGLGFAIPVEEVKSFLKHRDAFAYDNDNPNSAYRYLKPPSRSTAPRETTSR